MQVQYPVDYQGRQHRCIRAPGARCEIMKNLLSTLYHTQWLRLACPPRLPGLSPPHPSDLAKTTGTRPDEAFSSGNG
jgi:hypothetical protein